MKKIKLLALLLVSVLSINLMADTAEFSYSDLKGQGSSGSGSAFTGATKGSITMTGKGYGNNSYTQIYANGTLIFTPSNGATITKIELTATSGYIKTWKEGSTALSISGDKATWNGSSTSAVTLTNSASAQARITSMVVTYTAGKDDDDEPTGGIEITAAIFGSSTSYADCNGSHTCGDLQVTTSNVCVNNGMQFKASSGYMYNTNDLGAIESITIYGTNALTVYQGASEQPSTSSITSTGSGPYLYTFNGTNKYFKIVKTSSGAAVATKIVVNFSADPTPSCTDLTDPSGLNFSNVTMTGATLSWSGDAKASSFTVMVGDKTYENAISPLVVSDLQPETQYTWSVQAIGDGATYCTSSATEGTPFTTLADPSKKTITYNFNDANAYPSGFPTGGTNVANAAEFTISGNKIIINAPTSYYEINSTTDNRALFFGKSNTTLSSTAYLEFPAFKNYKLTKVVATTGSGVAGSVSMNIYNTSWTEVSTAQSTAGSTKKAFTFDIASDKQVLNAAYRLASNGSGKNLQFDNIVLTYAYVAPQSYNVTLSTDPANVGTITAKVDNVAIGAKVEEGKIVTLSATPNDVHAYRFKEWQSDDVTIEENAFEMPNKAVSITAVFEQLYAVSVTTAGEGSGTATINGGTETIYVSADDEITLVAEAAAGSEFGGWSTTDDILFDDETAANTTASAFGAGTITATFNKKQCTILGTPNVQVTDETYSSAKLTWDAVGNADYYMVFIPTVDIEEIVEGTQYEATGLSAKTQYTYQVIASSNNSDTYCDSNPAEGNFTTADYPAATLTLSENGTPREVTGLKVNTPFNLPNCSVECDKVFVGWSESNTDHSNLMAAGSEYTMTETTGTLYAWFATETLGTTMWNKVSSASEISDGTIIALAGTDGNNGYYAAKAWESPNTNVRTITATVEDNKLTSTEAFAALTLKANVLDSKTYYTIFDGANYWYANGATLSNAKNQLVGHSTLGTDGRDYWEISFSNGTASIKNKVDGRGTMQYNYNNASPIFSCYSSASQKAVVIFKKTTAASSYSDYSLTCSAKANVPEFSLAAGTYTEAKELNISAEEGATIYYTLDGTEPDNTKTPYEGAIQLNTYGKVTVKAIAYLAEKDPSDVVTKTYMMNLPFTSLEQLAAANVESGTEITITFPKTQIKSLAGTKGVYFNIQKEGKDIEIYCNSTDFPNTWEAGGYLNTKSALTCKWSRFVKSEVFQCWELTPSDWSAFEYSDPDPYTSVAELYAAGLVDGAKVYLNITNAYVHAKTYTSPNNFVYVQDGGVGIVLRTTETIADENFGKLMTAKIVGNLAYSNGRPQIAVTSLTDVSYTAGDRPAAVATTLSASEEASQILSLVKIDGYYAQSQNKQAKTAVITENADGTGARYTIYNLFGALKTVPESDKAINVKGLFYKKVESNVTSYSIVPVLVEDVALVTAADAPAASVDKGSEDDTNPTEVGNGEIITITPAAGFTASYILNDAAEKTITASEEKVTMTANSTLIIKSSRDYYTPTSKTYYYQINEALTYHSITKPIGNYTCELSAASAKQGDHVTITFTMNDHWYLDGVTVKNAANETETFAATKESDNVYGFDMPAYDVKLSTSTHGDPKYSITYQKGGIQAQGEDITEVAQYEGTVLTLKECTWTSDNYIFKGWKALYNNGESDVELPITNNQITVPAYDVKIIAQWNKIASYDWVLVTDANQLAAGDYVVIASNAKGKVAPKAITSGYMEPVEATFSDDYGYLKSVPTNAAVFTLGGEVGAWTLTDKDDRKLGATGKGKLAWDGQNATNTWTIAIDGTSHNATITNTAEGYGYFMHNVNNLNRLTTYTSSPTGTMLLPQLYKAVEHTYVVKYNLNGGANKPADSHADADGKVTITTDVPTYTGYKFLGWNAEQDGSGQEYVGGQEYTIEDDITVYAQWQQVEKYAVTYIANGATGKVPTETEKYETAKFSVKGQGELEYPDYIFRGWSDGENTYQEGDEYTMPNHAVEFTAQWESALDTHWALVLNVNQLQDGDKVIIAAANYDKALGAESDNSQYRHQVDVKKSTNKFYLSTLQTTPTELTLGIVNGKYTFNDGDGYLYAAGYATSKQNYLDFEEELEEGVWNITIEDGVASITSTVNEYVPVMSYNSSTPRFSCYTQIQGQGTLAIYKYYEYRPTFETRVVTPGKVGTVCYDNTILAVEGGTLYQPNYKDDAVKNIYFSEPDAYTAGLPMIFQADAEKLVLIVSADPETQVTEPIAKENARGMVGNLTNEQMPVPTGAYIFTQNKLWLAGTGCWIDPNRAYVDLSQVPFSDGQLNHNLPNGSPRRTISLGNGSAGAPTGVNNLREGDVVNQTQKFFYNGNIYMNVDGRTFDATGKMIK